MASYKDTTKCTKRTRSTCGTSETNKCTWAYFVDQNPPHQIHAVENTVGKNIYIYTHTQNMKNGCCHTNYNEGN